MRIEQQGPYECVLATMGALTGRSLAELREIAAKHGFRYTRPSGMNPMADYLDPSGRLRKLLGYDHPPHVVAETGYSGVTRVDGRWKRALPEKGRGVVRVKFGRKHWGHMMAWEDGIVLNPQSPDERLTLREYCKRYGASVTFYTIEQ